MDTKLRRNTLTEDEQDLYRQRIKVICGVTVLCTFVVLWHIFNCYVAKLLLRLSLMTLQPKRIIPCRVWLMVIVTNSWGMLPCLNILYMYFVKCLRFLPIVSRRSRFSMPYLPRRFPTHVQVLHLVWRWSTQWLTEWNSLQHRWHLVSNVVLMWINLFALTAYL